MLLPVFKNFIKKYIVFYKIFDKNLLICFNLSLSLSVSEIQIIKIMFQLKVAWRNLKAT